MRSVSAIVMTETRSSRNWLFERVRPPRLVFESGAGLRLLHPGKCELHASVLRDSGVIHPAGPTAAALSSELSAAPSAREAADAMGVHVHAYVHAYPCPTQTRNFRFSLSRCLSRHTPTLHMSLQMSAEPGPRLPVSVEFTSGVVLCVVSALGVSWGVRSGN